MNSIASAASGRPVPRHVWVLIALVVVLLGFAIGGALRSAIDLPAGPGAGGAGRTVGAGAAGRTVGAGAAGMR